MTKFLIDNGADVNSTSVYEKSILYEACSDRIINFDIMWLILSKGSIDLSPQCVHGGWTALHQLCWSISITNPIYTIVLCVLLEGYGCDFDN